MEKKKIVIQFVVGSFVIGFILSAIWFFWALNNTPSKGQIVTGSVTKYFLEIFPDFYLYKAEINPSSVSFSFGAIYIILPVIGGILNILMYNHTIKKRKNEEEIKNEVD